MVQTKAIFFYDGNDQLLRRVNVYSSFQPTKAYMVEVEPLATYWALSGNSKTN